MKTFFSSAPQEVYILGGLRTPLGAKNGQFKDIRPEHLGAAVLRELCQRYELTKLDGIFGGNATGTGGNLTRLMALSAGLSAPMACTVDMQCASGAAAIDFAWSRIRAGLGDVYLAGGMESASLQPVRQYDPKDDRYNRLPNGRYETAQFSPDTLSQKAMLEGAERTAHLAGISRDELDAWALRSHQKATAARKAGSLRDCIVPIDGQRDDESIHPRLSSRLLARMPRLLGPGTVTTAGNVCPLNDGAAFVVLCSGRFLQQSGYTPAAKLLYVTGGTGDPGESPRAAQKTADILLQETGLAYDDLDAIEFNEAFAVIDVLFARSQPQVLDRYNRFGGALAYGHPYGASGAVLVLHALHSLAAVHGRYGLAAIAGAGGTGEALLLEACP